MAKLKVVHKWVELGRVKSFMLILGWVTSLVGRVWSGQKMDLELVWATGRSTSPDRGFGTSCLLHCGRLTVSANSEDS